MPPMEPNMKYPKIQTLWMRDEKNKYVIMENVFSKKEFELFRKWSVTEKIDGTNVRVFISCFFNEVVTVRFGGRTNDAQMPVALMDFLRDTFTEELCKKQFFPKNWPENTERVDTVLFGEGYGGKIQRKSHYRDDISFILFDACIDGWWLNRKDVTKLAKQMKIESVPVIAEEWNLDQVQAFLQLDPAPMSNLNPETPLEGVVCQPDPLVMFRDGDPIKFKLKVEDYVKLERFGPKEEEPVHYKEGLCPKGRM